MSDDDRRLQEAAASELGQSLSEFIRQSALGRAEEILREHGRVVLDDDAATRFLAALDEDTPPPAALVELFARPRPFDG
jgi:uncharacterized protein (DUF1778 family)